VGISKDIGIGFSTYGKAISFIFRHNLWWFFAFPILFNIIIFWTGIEFKEYITEIINTKILGATGLDTADFFLSDFLKGTVSWIIGISFSIIFFFVFTYFGGYIVLIAMSPILAYLSEKTEKIYTGKDYPLSAEQLMRDIFRGILIAIRNMSIEFAYMLALLIIGFMPFIGWFFSIIGSFFLFFVSSYFYGFSFMDYSNERKRLNISKSVQLIRAHKSLAIVNGGIFSLSLIIPFCGVSLSGFFAIVSVVAASLAMTEVYQIDNIK